MAPKALNNSKPPQNSVLPVPPSALRQAPAGARRILTRGLSFGGEEHFMLHLLRWGVLLEEGLPCGNVLLYCISVTFWNVNVLVYYISIIFCLCSCPPLKASPLHGQDAAFVALLVKKEKVSVQRGGLWENKSLHYPFQSDTLYPYKPPIKVLQILMSFCYSCSHHIVYYPSPCTSEAREWLWAVIFEDSFQVANPQFLLPCCWACKYWQSPLFITGGKF